MTDIIAKLIGDPPSYGEHLEVIETIWLTGGVVRIKVQATNKLSPMPNKALMSLTAYSLALDYVETLDINAALAAPMAPRFVEYGRYNPIEFNEHCKLCSQSRDHYNHRRSHVGFSYYHEYEAKQ